MMSKLIDNIKRLAALIKGETKSGANTAERVGGLFEDVASELEMKYDRTESDEILGSHNTAGDSHRNIQDGIEVRIAGVDAELKQEIGEADARLTQGIAEVNEALGGHNAAADAHRNIQDQIEGRIAGVDAELRQEVAGVEANLKQEIGEADARLTKGIAEVNEALGGHNAAADAHRNIQDQIEGRITGVETELRQEVDGVDANLRQEIGEADARLTQGIADVNQGLSGHAGNGAIHKTSEQVRSEIVDGNIPATIARITEVDTKDSQNLEAAEKYVRECIAEIVANGLGGDPNFAASVMILINGKAPSEHRHPAQEIDPDASHCFLNEGQVSNFTAMETFNKQYDWDQVANAVKKSLDDFDLNGAVINVNIVDQNTSASGSVTKQEGSDKAKFDFKIPVPGYDLQEISDDPVIRKAGRYFYSGGDGGITLSISHEQKYEVVEIFAVSGDVTVFFGANTTVVRGHDNGVHPDIDSVYGGNFYLKIILENGHPKMCFGFGSVNI